MDPWGAVIAQCTEGIGLAMADIDLDYLYKIRQSMPVWKHRRYDLYADVTNTKSSGISSDNAKICFPDDNAVFRFGEAGLKGKTVIFKTDHSVAFTNRKCVVPGRILCK